MTTKKTIIIGCSPFSRYLGKRMYCASGIETEAYAVSKRYLKENKFAGLPVLAFEQLGELYKRDEFEIQVTLGYRDMNQPVHRIWLYHKNRIMAKDYTIHRRLLHMAVSLEAWRFTVTRGASHMEDRKRLNVIKGILMSFVVVGHFLQIIEWSTPETVKPILRAVISLMYSFHMPMFVGISGYFSINTEKRRDHAFKELLVPYFMFQIVFCLLNVFPQNIGGVIQNIFVPQFGLWYLLALFIWRLIAKDLSCIKGVIYITAMLSICTCFFSDIGNGMALQRVIGFMVYFALGLLLRERKWKIKKLPRTAVVIIVFIELIAFTFVDSQNYQFLLDVFCHRILYKNYDLWFTASAIYGVAFILAIFNSWLMFSVVPERNSFAEKIGEDTFPVYISHLALYIIITRIPGQGIVRMIFAGVSIVLSLTFFASEKYRKRFKNVVLNLTNAVYMRDSS